MACDLQKLSNGEMSSFCKTEADAIKQYSLYPNFNSSNFNFVQAGQKIYCCKWNNCNIKDIKATSQTTN